MQSLTVWRKNVLFLQSVLQRNVGTALHGVVPIVSAAVLHAVVPVVSAAEKRWYCALLFLWSFRQSAVVSVVNAAEYCMLLFL